MLKSDFDQLLRLVRNDLTESLNTVVIKDIPDARSDFDEGQAEIWRRLEEWVKSASYVFPDHCELCKQEFTDSVNSAISLIDRYTANMLTEPRKIWSVTYKSNDGQHGFTKVFGSKSKIQEKEGYQVGSIDIEWVFKEEHREVE